MMSLGQLFAQGKIEMADGLRSEGKIYVVVLVMLVIFSAVAVYLFTIDRKITKLEKDK
ncbi:MAG: CcmD family protein [Sphingobacterium sp.]